MSKTAKNGGGPAPPRRRGNTPEAAAKQAAKKATARRAKPEPWTEGLLPEAWDYTYRNRHQFAG